jgi:hypothetical protein
MVTANILPAFLPGKKADRIYKLLHCENVDIIFGRCEPRIRLKLIIRKGEVRKGMSLGYVDMITSTIGWPGGRAHIGHTRGGSSIDK